MAKKKPADKVLYTSNQDISFRDKEGNMIGGIEAGFKPYPGGSEYMAPNPSTAGAGRGKQGGPSAKELRDEERKQNRGVYTAEMGQPPMDPEGKKKGGAISSASRRADGIAQRGKTRGTMVMCGGGYAKGK
jgi:hypothetical protein